MRKGKFRAKALPLSRRNIIIYETRDNLAVIIDLYHCSIFRSRAVLVSALSLFSFSLILFFFAGLYGSVLYVMWPLMRKSGYLKKKKKNYSHKLFNVVSPGS